MVNSIPASRLVNITPGVVAAGGSSLDFNGLILTDDVRAPVGQVLSFGSPDLVSRYFGPQSLEYEMAQVYFAGFDNSTVKPGELLFTRYVDAAAAGWVRGAPVTLDELKADTSGTLTITVDGTTATSTALNLSGATSPSAAAGLIEAAFSTVSPEVTYDVQSGGLLITSPTTGAASLVTITDGPVAQALKLVVGATVSPGAAPSDPETFLDEVTQSTQNFVTFSTVFEPSVNDMFAFAEWNSRAGDRYAYIAWDTDLGNLSQNPTTTLMARIRAADIGGTHVIFTRDLRHQVAAFVQGYFASLSFTETNGRATLAYRSQEGLVPDVTNAGEYDVLRANGLNFYGRFASANDTFNRYQPGSISGKFLWSDSYANQIWINNQFQLALMVLLGVVKNIPYNDQGYGLISAALLDPITDALNFGAIRTGVTLSAAQRAAVNNAAGLDIADTLENAGWYLQIQDAAPAVRVERGSPPIRFWYMDGQSVQEIDMSSLQVQ